MFGPLAVLVASCLPAQPPPPGVDPKDWPYYANVEIVARLKSTHEKWEPMYLVLPVGKKPHMFILDASELPGWTDEELVKVNGKTVRVKARALFKKVGTGPTSSELKLALSGRSLEVVQPPKEGEKEPRYEANIEVVADFSPPLQWPERLGELIIAGPPGAKLWLDLNGIPLWSQEKRARARGHPVRASGTLELQPIEKAPGKSVDEMVVVARSLEELERKRPER